MMAREAPSLYEAGDLILSRPSEQVLGMPRSCWEQPF
jgi:hypothetical protein